VRRSHLTILRRAFLATSVVWAVLLPVASYAASHASYSYALAFVVYGAGSVVCHQLPARSFHLWAVQMPVCARCTGIYVGAAVASLIATVRLGDTVRLKPDPTYAPSGYVVSAFSRTIDSAQRARTLLALASLPTALTLIDEWTTGDVPSNIIRALAGAPLGAAVALVIVGSLTGARKVN
jgi:uncharacterized membrane protein